MIAFNNIVVASKGSSISTTEGDAMAYPMEFSAPPQFQVESLKALVLVLAADKNTPCYLKPTLVHLQGKAFPPSLLSLEDCKFELIILTYPSLMLKVDASDLSAGYPTKDGPSFTISGNVVDLEHSGDDCALVAPIRRSSWQIGAPYDDLIPSPESSLFAGDTITLTGPFRGRKVDERQGSLLLFDLRMLETPHDDYTFARFPQDSPDPVLLPDYFDRVIKAASMRPFILEAFEEEDAVEEDAMEEDAMEEEATEKDDDGDALLMQTDDAASRLVSPSLDGHALDTSPVDLLASLSIADTPPTPPTPLAGVAITRKRRGTSHSPPRKLDLRSTTARMRNGPQLRPRIMNIPKPLILKKVASKVKKTLKKKKTARKGKGSIRA